MPKRVGRRRVGASPLVRSCVLFSKQQTVNTGLRVEGDVSQLTLVAPYKWPVGLRVSAGRPLEQCGVIQVSMAASDGDGRGWPVGWWKTDSLQLSLRCVS